MVRTILNITNGGCAVEVMHKADIPGVYLPWSDVLHDGPVPDNLSLEKLSEVRAEFIVSRGWGSPERINQLFIDRDNTLKSFKQYDEVILWFEHDLYDQLQILQILDWFYHNSEHTVDLSLICTDKYLGPLSPDEMKGLLKCKEVISEDQLLLSSNAWSAFRSNSPEEWCKLIETDTSSLPFLDGAIKRLLEEYPNSKTGLSRTSHQALKIISEGEKRPGEIFGRSQDLEDRIFLGDSSFWVILHDFLNSPPPVASVA